MTKERLEEILKENGINMTTFISLADYNAVVESMKIAVNEAIGEADDVYWDSVNSCGGNVATTSRKILNLKIIKD